MAALEVAELEVDGLDVAELEVDGLDTAELAEKGSGAREGGGSRAERGGKKDAGRGSVPPRHQRAAAGISPGAMKHRPPSVEAAPAIRGRVVADGRLRRGQRIGGLN